MKGETGRDRQRRLDMGRTLKGWKGETEGRIERDGDYIEMEGVWKGGGQEGRRMGGRESPKKERREEEGEKNCVKVFMNKQRREWKRGGKRKVRYVRRRKEERKEG